MLLLCGAIGSFMCEEIKFLIVVPATSKEQPTRTGAGTNLVESSTTQTRDIPTRPLCMSQNIDGEAHGGSSSVELSRPLDFMKVEKGSTTYRTGTGRDRYRDRSRDRYRHRYRCRCRYRHRYRYRCRYRSVVLTGTVVLARLFGNGCL